MNSNINLKKNLILFVSFFVFSFSFFNLCFSAAYISDSQQEVIRDSKRLNDLTIFRKAIEEYKTKNGYYPKLETGTNIKGYVNSAWSTQWTSFCNLIGLSSCPVDPINTIVGCDCKIFNSNGSCAADNVNSNIDTTSCYNSKSQTFACTDGSNIYQYQSLNNGRNYSLGMEFEYSDNVNWQVASSSSDNIILIKGGCASGGNPYKVFSNKSQKCGDGILSYGEVCEVGSRKTEFCKTSDNKTGIRYINCSNSCLWNSSNVGECLIIGFCGDNIIQADKDEECDGGYQKMCYSYQDYLYKNSSDPAASSSHYNWYNEQIRYCGLNCKWNSNYIDSTAYCGGYCGDNIVQGDKGEECDNPNNKHCNLTTCKYQNSTPVIDFDFFKNRYSSKSYIKSNVWSGDKFQYKNDYYGTNNTDLIIADKQNNEFVAIWNSDFIEIKINVADKENDKLLYKYAFPASYNFNFAIKYAKSSDNSKTFYEYKAGEYVDGGDIIRMYPTTVKNGKNTYKYGVEDKNNLLFGSNYIGYYSLEVVVQEDYSEGQNNSINPQHFITSKTIDFKIGPGCGDRILQKELGEACEVKSDVSINNIYTNWGIFQPTSTSQNGYCAITVYNSKTNTWADKACTDKYYGICEKRKEQGCDETWITGENDNCYKLTTQRNTWDLVEQDCELNNAKLVVFDNKKEVNFLNKIDAFKFQTSLWIGYRKYSNSWVSIRGGKWNSSRNTYGYDVLRDYIYDSSNGVSLSDQYSCGLPWEYNSCGDSAGYCGDGVDNNLFEECDETDKSSYGIGYDIYNQYECKKSTLACSNTQQSSYDKNAVYGCNFVNNLTNNPNQYNCRSSGGYCGDGFFQNTYEHCDASTRITAAASGSSTFGINNFDHQYVCTPASNGVLPYEDNNDFELSKNTDLYAPCRKSSGGYCGDSKIQSFYSKDTNNNYIIKDTDIYTQQDFGWKNVAFDGIAKKHYFINGKTAQYLKGAPKDYFTQAQEDMFIEECDPNNYSPVSILPKESFEGVQYGGCASASDTSDPCVLEFYTEGTRKGVLKKHSGNCGCRKIEGGYCGNGNIEADFQEVCDPEFTDYTDAKLTKGNKTTILENSSVSNQYFCGATTKYSENVADLNQYDASGKIIKTFENINGSDFSCQKFGGYCGDGIVQSDYTTRVLQSNQLYFYSHAASLEQCDPKNHSVVAKYSSATNSYTCGSVNTSKACNNLNFSEKDLNNKYGGYCGDGKIQYDLTKTADNQGGVIETGDVSISANNPEECDPTGHYVVPSISSVSNQYACGITTNDNACTDISGYCGDGVVNSYYNWTKYTSGSNEPNGLTAENCVVMDGKNDEYNGKWIDVDCSWALNYVCEQENPTNTNCYGGFTKWSDGNNNCYYVSSNKMAYNQISCPSGSHRAIINSQRENDYVSGLVNKINDWAFIGLSDTNREGEFVWSDNIGLVEECDPNSSDYKINTTDRILVGQASASNVNKQYLCGSVNTWSSIPSDVHKYDVDGNYISSFVFNNKVNGNNAGITFGGYCGDGMVQYNLYTTTKKQTEENQRTFFYSNPNGSLEQCDPTNRVVYSRNSSVSNQYACGASGSSDACKNKGGYCGDGIVQSDNNEQCDYASKTGNDYADTLLVENGQVSILKNSSYLKQYRCGRPQKFTTSSIPGIKNKYNASGSTIVSFLDSDFISENNIASCVTFGGYCGDGKVQSTYNLEKSQSDQEWFRTNSSSLEQCDPNGHSVVARYSSITNSYTCGSVNTDKSCYNLNFSEKDLNNKYGGYCGDGKIQYDLTKTADSQAGAIETAEIIVSNNNPEQCDPNGHSVSPAKSSENNQYACGASGNVNACLDIGGYCGDDALQSQYNESCDVGPSLQGISDRTNQFCGTCVKFNCSDGSNMIANNVYLVRKNILISTYTGSYAIMNALSASLSDDVIFISNGGFEFSNDYSINLTNKNITINSCASAIWNWK